jgi:hypothetical protein
MTTHRLRADIKAIFAGAAVAAAVTMTAIPAQAKGCLKGALIGGVAGHYAGHHGVLGAAAGCVIGRHEAKKHDRAMANPSPDPAH